MSTGSEGHRSRLKKRFLLAGRDGLSEHELLELLLFYSIPRKDVKPLAKELLNRFGSIEAVLAAGSEQLMQSSGIGESSIVLLKLIRTVSTEIMSRPLRAGINLKDPVKLIDYLKMNCRRNDREVLQLLLLDRSCCLLDTLTLDGGENSLSAGCGDLLFKILACRGTRQVIIAHNHLNNIINPSVSDIRSTLFLKNLLQNIGVVLLDHFIITPEKCLSIMKTASRMEK